VENSYITISGSGTSLFKDRGSKFFGYAIPIFSVDDVKPALEKIAEEHPSARHVCYAYLVGENGEQYRANDDGEPSGSAGLPILNQIKSKEVTNTLVAVVRYFGGTKLGVSGLINAYKEAAKEALEQTNVVERIPSSILKIQFPHSSTRAVERIIRQNNLKIADQVFGQDCRWSIETPVSESETARSLFGAIPELSFY
jgi:uncharacterized YigZ family protein